MNEKFFFKENKNFMLKENIDFIEKEVLVMLFLGIYPKQMDQTKYPYPI
jgi:hypothetical protein